MKKTKVLALTVAGCLIVPLAFGLSGCGQHAGFALNKNTNLYTLTQNLENHKNYTIFEETSYDINNKQQYCQVAYYSSGNVGLTVTSQNTDTKTAMEYAYTYNNYEHDNLITYNVVVANFNYENGEYSFFPKNQFRVVFAEKQFSEYNPDKIYLGDIENLEMKEGQITTNNSQTRVEFINNSLTTTSTENDVTTRTTLLNVGTTRVNLTNQVLLAAESAEWASSVTCNEITYTYENGGYTANIAASYWDNNSVANLLETINTLKVQEMKVEPKLSFENKKIVLPFNTENHSLIGKNVKFNFGQFAQAGGIVEYQNETIVPTVINENTTLDEITEIVESKNYTLTKLSTILDENNQTTTTKITSIYADDMFIEETLETINGQEFNTTKYGFFLNGHYYEAIFTNYDMDTKQLYANNNFLFYSYNPVAELTQQGNPIEGLAEKLTVENNKLITTKVLCQTDEANLSFDTKSVTLKTQKLITNNGTFVSLTQETWTVYNVGITTADIPNAVIEKIKNLEGIS